MSFKDLASSEKIADRNRDESAELAEQLRAKRVRYNGDGKLEPWPGGKQYAQAVRAEFQPDTAGLAVSIDSIRLSGGPFDGVETKVPRGIQYHDRPTAGGDGFVPAHYRRTVKRDDGGLVVFQYQEVKSLADAP